MSCVGNACKDIGVHHVIVALLQAPPLVSGQLDVLFLGPDARPLADHELLELGRGHDGGVGDFGPHAPVPEQGQADRGRGLPRLLPAELLVVRVALHAHFLDLAELLDLGQPVLDGVHHVAQPVDTSQVNRPLPRPWLQLAHDVS